MVTGVIASFVVVGLARGPQRLQPRGALVRRQETELRDRIPHAEPRLALGPQLWGLAGGRVETALFIPKVSDEYWPRRLAASRSGRRLMSHAVSARPQ